MVSSNGNAAGGGVVGGCTSTDVEGVSAMEDVARAAAAAADGDV